MLQKNNQFIQILVFIIFFLVNTAFATGEYNQKDAQGQRQGPWRDHFSNGSLRYEGQFKDDQPVGVFKYYYPQGGLRSELIHTPGEDAVKATHYYRNRQIMGEGFFVEKQMHGLWRFLNEQGVLVAEHYYDNGENHGVWKTYFSDGAVAEEETWHRGKRHGPMKRYYPDGSVYINANYYNDLLDGLYQVYYANGTLRVEGQYNKDVNDHVWTYYTEQGEIERTISFKNGMVEKEEIFIETEQEDVPLRPGPSLYDDPMQMGGFY